MISDNYFTGMLEDDWNKNHNWSSKRVPNLCEKVIISGDPVKVKTGMHARAAFIETETGSLFETEAGAVMSINPD
ncbi:hypothetical protein EGI22_10370 [Lacihabitans sp. LS3-19]|uniref:hypothetical protein n=1 Tax=Lacihabitans sp. LS3-19 TaxID=2487335 RepID=UPI0020CD6B94|nr:hypothetical protein [Lacihabitans sp. LS3-19]MCP9768318.1 hypothetical protein [Lacihabitans sp. LS3-19]